VISNCAIKCRMEARRILDSVQIIATFTAHFVYVCLENKCMYWRYCMFSKEIGLFDIIPEGDAMQMVKAIFTDLSTWSKFGHFIERINEIVMSLRLFRVVHTRREANSTTHILAKATSAQARDLIYLIGRSLTLPI